MLILRKFSNTMIPKLVERLKEEKVEDFEVSQKVGSDVISVGGELGCLKFYIPRDLDYFQYELDDFIRQQAKFVRTQTGLERNIYVMKLQGSLTLAQLVKVVKYIIEEQGYCLILDI